MTLTTRTLPFLDAVELVLDGHDLRLRARAARAVSPREGRQHLFDALGDELDALADAARYVPGDDLERARDALAALRDARDAYADALSPLRAALGYALT
jgi:hypothetical protein